jgi:DNA-binding transcriptional MerR regulator
MQKISARNMKASNAYPDKLFYKIGEVSKIAGVEPYVLRYWESEFQFLKPRKSKSGQRIYVKKDLDLIFQIKNLLYKERYTIEGVRKKLGDVAPVRKPSAPQRAASPNSQSLEHIKQRLREILKQLR